MTPNLPSALYEVWRAGLPEDATGGAVRHQIEMMLSSGIGTDAFPRADTHEAIQEIIRQLRESRGSLEGS